MPAPIGRIAMWQLGIEAPSQCLHIMSTPWKHNRAGRHGGQLSRNTNHVRRSIIPARFALRCWSLKTTVGARCRRAIATQKHPCTAVLDWRGCELRAQATNSKECITRGDRQHLIGNRVSRKSPTVGRSRACGLLAQGGRNCAPLPLHVQ